MWSSPLRSELDRLLYAWVAGFRPDSRALEQRFDDMELDDSGGMAGMAQLFSDPQILLGAMQSPEQAALRPQLDALVAVIVGFVDHLLDQIGTSLLSSYAPLSEAMRRQRVESARRCKGVQSRAWGRRVCRSATEARPAARLAPPRC